MPRLLSPCGHHESSTNQGVPCRSGGKLHHPVLMRDRRLGHCPRCKLSLQATPHVPNSVSQIHSYVSTPSPTPPFLAGTLTFSSSTPPMNPVFLNDVPHLSSDPVPGLLVSTTLVLPTGKRVTMQALVDSGASACFMDAEYAINIRLRQSLATIPSSWKSSMDGTLPQVL